MVLPKSLSAAPTSREVKDRFRHQRRVILRYAQMMSQEDCSVQVVICRSGMYYAYNSEGSDKWLPSEKRHIRPLHQQLGSRSPSTERAQPQDTPSQGANQTWPPTIEKALESEPRHDRSNSLPKDTHDTAVSQGRLRHDFRWGDMSKASQVEALQLIRDMNMARPHQVRARPMRALPPILKERVNLDNADLHGDD